MLRKKTLGLVFANMHDSAVGDMTATRSMGSLPFGGRYRLIDFGLSSLTDAGVTKVGVIAKSNYHSLMDHLGSGLQWDLSRKRGGLSIFPPHRYFDETETLYHGRIQALYNVLNYIKNSDVGYVVLMDCDYVCNIDIDKVVSYHADTNADVTVVCCDIMPDVVMCKNCITLKTDENGRAKEMFVNKSVESGVLSMNIFVIAKETLISMIEDAMTNMYRFFERDILADKIDTIKIQCYMHRGFTRRIYSTKSYYDATMSLLDYNNLTDLFPADRPVYTKVRDEAPVRYGLKSTAKNTLLADGCVIDGRVENCVLFRGVKIEAGASVKNSILMQNTIVKQNAELNFVITDKDVVISADRTLEGDANYPLYIKKASVV